jgi:zinc protease
MGIEDSELPIVAFEFAIDGGRLREDVARPGLAAVTAEMLTRGTETKTRAEFENALQSLGAQVRAQAGEGHIFVFGHHAVPKLRGHHGVGGGNAAAPALGSG